MGETGPRIHVAGDVLGQFVVGDHNVTVWAEQSVVTVLPPGERPRPERRPVIDLRPRAGAEPIGRDADLARLSTATETARLVQVYGPPGTGKTTFLRHAATRPGDDMVFLSAAGRDIGDVLQDVFETCYDTHGYRPGAVELRQFMADVPVKLFLDDLDVPQDQRVSLLDCVPDATVVFTTGHRTLWTDGQTLELGGLSEESGLALITRLLDRPLAAEERAAATQLWQAGDGSPLALLRAVAGARRAADGTVTLPRAAELAELLPTVLARLGAQAREIVAVLALANGSPIAGELLPWLIADATTAPGALTELTDLGVALTTGPAFHLAPGIALPPDMLIGGQHLDWVTQRLCQWAALPGQSPHAIADHAGLITGTIDATIAYARPGMGGMLAKVTAPLAECSLRFGAWEQILAHGIAAAQAAGDRKLVAYLTHEDGVHKLLTGKRVAAVAALGTAIALWHELGSTAHIATAQHIQGIAAPMATHAATATLGAAPHLAAAPQAVAAAKAGVLGTKAGLSAKAGIGLGTKLAIAGAATAAVAGGTIGFYIAVHHSPPPARAVASEVQQLNGIELEAALLPADQLLPPGLPRSGSDTNSGGKLLVQTKVNWSALTCQQLGDMIGDEGEDTPATFGESAWAGRAASVPESDVFGYEEIVQYPSPAAATGFYDGFQHYMTICGGSNIEAPNGVILTVIDGNQVVEVPESVGVMFVTMHGDCVYIAKFPVGGDGTVTTQDSQADLTLMSRIIANVAAIARAPEDVVRQYFAAITARDYQTAWSLGGDHTGQTYQEFVTGLSTTQTDTVTIDSVDGDTVVADLSATQTDGSTKTYHGTYTVSGAVITQFSVQQTG